MATTHGTPEAQGEKTKAAAAEKAAELPKLSDEQWGAFTPSVVETATLAVVEPVPAPLAKMVEDAYKSGQVLEVNFGKPEVALAAEKHLRRYALSRTTTDGHGAVVAAPVTVRTSNPGPGALRLKVTDKVVQNRKPKEEAVASETAAK